MLCLNVISGVLNFAFPGAKATMKYLTSTGLGRHFPCPLKDGITEDILIPSNNPTAIHRAANRILG